MSDSMFCPWRNPISGRDDHNRAYAGVCQGFAKQSKADNEQIMQDAVTRILATIISAMGQQAGGYVAAHLKHSIAYICNEAKTENGSLVGGINCLPDFAYEQMIGTKEMFGQTGGRQGYHFIISLKPGEGTREQMYEITRRFAEEFLGGEYEAQQETGYAG